MSSRDNIRRRNLLHLYFDNGNFFITYRLKDSLPVEFVQQIHDDLSKAETFTTKEKNLFKKYDELLDSGFHGNKFLGIKEIAELNIEIINSKRECQYDIICYCIMPNHVHLVMSLIKGNNGISKIMQSIKGVSALECNKILKRSGCFWQDESFDRWIRDDKELFNIINYVINNPVKAGLVKNWQDWKYTYVNKKYFM